MDKIPGICDPQVGNSGSVNREALPFRHSSYGARQTGNEGEVGSHSFRLEVKPEEPTTTSDVDSKKKRHYSTQSFGRHEHSNDMVT